jgi:hypothetical protein
MEGMGERESGGKVACALDVLSLAYKRASARGKGAKDAEGHLWRLEGHQGTSENELQPARTVLV